MRQKAASQAPEEIMAFSLGDSDVSLFLSGFWKGALQANTGYSFSPLGDAPFSPETPLLFTQEVDLTLSLWLKDRWFVEAGFLDDYALNTYRAGYQGNAGEFVQYAGVGNKGLDFPSFSYLDLGGDSPSSFGFYGHFNGGNVNIHSLFRYDAAARDEKVFFGGRERTYSYIQPQNSVRGVSFVLSDTDIDSDIHVYIEDETGSIRDSSGRRWRLLGPSEYAAGRTQGLLELGTKPGGMVAVVYSKGADKRPWNNTMGDYSDPSGFLSEVQKWFNSISLEKFPQCGGNGAARPGEVFFNGIYALVVFEPGTFSPFERQSRYDAPSSTSEEAALVRFSTGSKFSGFELTPLETSPGMLDFSFNPEIVTRRFIFELLAARVGSNTIGYDNRDPAARWPLAEDYPQVYLPGSDVFTGDIALRFTNYSGFGAYFVGVDVIPGSVQVWRSGIQDPNFRYNSSSGEVTLSSPAGANELIRITYLKRSDETRLGSIAAGIGAIYNKPASPFSVSAAMGIRWNLTGDDSFSEEDASSPGTVGISAKAALNYDNLKVHIATGLAFEQPDTTGLYRVAGMEGNEITLALPPESSFVSQPPAIQKPSVIPDLNISNRADLIYRNYRNNNIAGSTLMPIDWSGSSLISGQNRPYPAMDPLLGNDTRVMVAEFALNNNNKWTGFQVPLGYNAGFLSRSGEIEIPFRLYGFSQKPLPDFKLIVQIGSLSGEDFAFSENPDLVWERVLFSGEWETIPPVSDMNTDYSRNPAAFNHDSRIARFILNDEDSLKLGNAKYLRIIAVYDGGIGEEVRGRILLAPPIIRATAFRPVTFKDDKINSAADFSFLGQNNVNVMETMEISGYEDSLEAVYSDTIKRLHPAGARQRVLKIEWKDMNAGISAGADGRIGALPLADYSKLSFFVKGPVIAEGLPGAGDAIAAGTLSFMVADGPDSVSLPHLEASIPLAAFRPGKWSKVTICYQGSDKGVFVDGGEANGASFRYRAPPQQLDAPKGKAYYIAMLVNPENETDALANGSIYVDEIILEDSTMVYRLNAGAGIEFKKPGTMLLLGGIPVLADFLASTLVESEFRGDPFAEEASLADINGSMNSRSRVQVSVFGVKLQGNLAFTAAKDNFLWSADHGISREIGPLSVREAFYAAPAENSAGHNVNMKLSFPFYAAFDADMKHELSRLERKWNIGIGYKPSNDFIPSVAVKTSAAWADKDGKIEENESYGNLWARTWEPLMPDVGEGADSRKTAAEITITEATKPVGFVIGLDGSTYYVNVNNITRCENSAFLDVPVSLSKTNLNFRMGRGFKKHLSFSGEDVLEDGEKFLESINDFLVLWEVAPFYSLFAHELNDAMDKSHENSPSFASALYTSFRDHFGIRASFSPVYNLAAFIVPSNAGFRMERVLEQKLDTRSDMLNIGGSLGFSAVNMFGAMGYLPLFNFYRSDEFTNSLEAAVIIPQEEETSWRFQAVTGAGFHGFSGGQLNFTNMLTLRSDGSWLESIRGEWMVPGQKSLLGVFYRWVFAAAEKQNSWPGLSSLLKTEYEQLRCESLELALENTLSGNEHYFRWRLSLGHESIVRILGRLNLSAFAKLNFSEDTHLDIFTFDTLIGITLRLSF